MTKSLRKRHFQIWSALLIFLPLTILFGTLAIPPQVTSTLLQPDPGAAFPIVLQTINKEHCSINLRTTNDSSQLQLEWINKKALTTPTAVIYKIARRNGNEKKELVGRIEARGTYRFALRKKDISFKPSFLVYDLIHNRNIETIKF